MVGGFSKDLKSDGSREHMAGDVPGKAGRGKTASARRDRKDISATPASYAISDEQGGKEKVLDNRQ